MDNGTRKADDALTRQLTRLHGAHYAQLVRIWAPRCASRENAEDLVQDAFARLYRRYRSGSVPAGLEDDDVLLRMLHVIVRNLLIDHHRRAATQRRQDSMKISLDAALVTSTIANIEACTPIAWDQPVEEEIAARQLLNRLLDKLDPHWARVLALLCDDFSPTEIGEAMEGRNGHVLVRRTREHVCRLLAEFAAVGDRAAVWMGRRFCGWPATTVMPDRPT